jgi:O-acetyl-ADP-ribose deacetylase (regulator of RNase III)
LDFVTVHQVSILDVACDAVVSPANSFGFMDGGIDAVYLSLFGKVS